jgi:hypothetical protein
MQHEKTDAGAADKPVYFFTWPNVQICNKNDVRVLKNVPCFKLSNHSV